MTTQSSSSSAIPPITEDDIANYLANTPDFFERHADVLTSVQLPSPHGGRAVSLQERQAEMLRDKIRALEQRTMEMIRHSGENTGIVDKMLLWVADLLRARDAAALPRRIVDEIQTRFNVPQAAIRVWDVAEGYRAEPFAQDAGDNARAFAASLTAPFCGANLGFEPAAWLGDAAAAKSLALLPLRDGPIEAAGTAFGMLVLGSPDPQRFEAGMGTDFLERIAELASAALSRLR
ncbi:DUF484 family protein [Ramlibacter sp. H39-3-26]|uniref:DUF484 family protein n=1 Tax=Curvibacter soli TaxID=3031331 RepID=UPI0023DAC0F5|nr:DUF484 family protein [Ramlibacter sp. H39-3-26]MDF1484696.1 DUF484 family protein [Ramlibacter sp. H39-3-26]